MVLASCVAFFKGGYYDRLVDKTYGTLDRGVSLLGFSLEDVVVEGRDRTPKEDILKLVKVKKGEGIFGIDLPILHRELGELKWVRSVIVERRLPQTLYIRLIERKPIGFWQQNGLHFLIDQEGTLIAQATLSEFPDFLVTTGRGAPESLPKLLEKLEAYPQLKSKVVAAVYVGHRRWDLVLKSKTYVKLPEGDITQALSKMNDLDKKLELVNKDYKSIDLRHKEKIFFLYTPEALERKKKQLSENAA